MVPPASPGMQIRSFYILQLLVEVDLVKCMLWCDVREREFAPQELDGALATIPFLVSRSSPC